MNTLSLFLDSPLADTLGWTVLHSLWQGVLIVLLLKAALQWGQKRWSVTRSYYLAYATLLGQFLLAVGTFYYLLPATEGLASVGAAASPFLSGAGPMVSDSSWWSELEARITPSLPLIVAGWWIGMVFFLLRLLVSYYWWHSLRRRIHLEVPAIWEERFQQLKTRMGVRRKVDLRASVAISSPLLLGQLKPLILLPLALVNQLSLEQVEAVLAHELAHLRRYDYWFNVVQLLLEAVFYYHPASWWLGHKIRILREQCCDDLAVRYTGNSMAYAKTLLTVATQQQQPSPTFALGLLGNNKRHLLHRVQRILNQPVKQPDMREKFAVTSGLLVLALLVSLSTGWSGTAEDNYLTNNDFSVILADTLPKGDFKMEIDEDGETMEVTVKEGKIKSLNINGKEIPEADFPKYESMVEEKIASVPPPPPPPPAPAPPAPPSVHGAPPAPPVGKKTFTKTVTTTKTSDGEEQTQVIIFESDEEEGERVIRMDTDPLGVIKIKTKNGKDHLFLRGTDEEEEFDFDIDMDDIEQVEVIKIKRGDLEGLEEIELQLKDMDEDMQLEMIEVLEKWKADNEEMEIIIDEEQIEREVEREIRDQERTVRDQERQIRVMERQVERQLRVQNEDDPNWLGRKLLADGLIKTDKKYSFKLSDKRLKVNGKTQSDELHQRYLRFYEASTGSALGESFSITINHEED